MPTCAGAGLLQVNLVSVRGLMTLAVGQHRHMAPRGHARRTCKTASQGTSFVLCNTFLLHQQRNLDSYSEWRLCAWLRCGAFDERAHPLGLPTHGRLGAHTVYIYAWLGRKCCVG